MEKKSLYLLLCIFGIILSVIATILFVSPFVVIQFGSISRTISGFELMQGGEYICEGGSGFGIEISFFLCLIISLISIILPLIRRLQASGKLKKPEKQKTINGNIRIVASTIMGLIPLIIDFLTMKLTKYDSNSLAHLGGGAIASGILILFGSTLTTFAMVLLEENDDAVIQDANRSTD